MEGFMEIELNTNQAFDEYAARFGWEYDNGGQYGDLAWDWYASNAHRWGRRGDGTVRHTVVIMRRNRASVCAVHFAGGESREIWSGEIGTSADFDRLCAIIDDYMSRQAGTDDDQCRARQ
jgi:hypothetical protein